MKRADEHVGMLIILKRAGWFGKYLKLVDFYWGKWPESNLMYSRYKIQQKGTVCCIFVGARKCRVPHVVNSSSLKITRRWVYFRTDLKYVMERTVTGRILLFFPTGSSRPRQLTLFQHLRIHAIFNILYLLGHNQQLIIISTSFHHLSFTHHTE